ncbi:hypothetical protein [Bacillus sp. JJ675]|uniref:hypothetical protein n=1 Tax=Bacillus sp. JJ675 TaxID=3122972 RepID=UPI00300012F0
MRKIILSLLITCLVLANFFISMGDTFAAENNQEKTDYEVTSIKKTDDLQYDVNKNLTQEEIVTRFNEINTKYTVGQAFSDQDDEFVKFYADSEFKTSVESNSGISISAIQWYPGQTASKSFSTSKSSNGVKVKFSGRVYGTIGIVNHSYRGKMSAKIVSGKSKVKKALKVRVTHSSYGLVGKKSIGIVYNSGKSSTGTKTKVSMDNTVKYSALAVVYTYTNAYVSVTTKTGSFNKYAF